MKDYEKAIEEASHKTRDPQIFYQGLKSLEAKEYWQQGMYTEEDLRNAFDSAREFDSIDGVVDVHIVINMGDVSDLSPLYSTFDDWLNKLKNHE